MNKPLLIETQARWVYGVLTALLLSVSLWALCTGAGPAGPQAFYEWVMSRPQTVSAEQLQVTFEILRLPRLYAALLVGAALGLAGAFMQTATRNVLAEPGLLGINAGAALGVVIGIAFFGADTSLSYLPWAATGALLGHVGVLVVAQRTSSSQAPLRLILAGTAFSASCQGVSSVILMSQAANYDQFRFWSLGILSNVSPEAIHTVGPVLMFGILMALCMSHPLSALRLGDDLARTLGHQPIQLRCCVVLVVAVLAGASLALVGPISFLGLLAPFIARRLTGQHLTHTLWCSALVGALLLVVSDLLARSITQPFETPVGIFLAIMGAPLLIWMVRTTHTMAHTRS